MAHDTRHVKPDKKFSSFFSVCQFLSVLVLLLLSTQVKRFSESHEGDFSYTLNFIYALEHKFYIVWITATKQQHVRVQKSKTFFLKIILKITDYCRGVISTNLK